MLSAVMLFASSSLLMQVSLPHLVLMLVVSPVLSCFVVVAAIVGVGIYVVRYIAHDFDFAVVASVLTRVMIDVYRCCHRYCCFVGCVVRLLYMFAVLSVLVNCSDGGDVCYVVVVAVDNVVVVVGVGVGGCCGDYGWFVVFVDSCVVVGSGYVIGVVVVVVGGCGCSCAVVVVCGGIVLMLLLMMSMMFLLFPLVLVVLMLSMSGAVVVVVVVVGVVLCRCRI